MEHEGDLVDADLESTAEMTPSIGTSHSREILRFSPSEMGWSLRHTITCGWMPRLRSSVTECCVGLVFCSPLAARYGTKVRWT